MINPRPELSCISSMKIIEFAEARRAAGRTTSESFQDDARTWMAIRQHFFFSGARLTTIQQ
jgi:hypothetical protein